MDSRSLLQFLVEKGWNRLGDTPGRKAYRARLQQELEVIFTTGYEDYFLIVWDVVNWAKRNDILCSPARGSVAGSLVAYLLNITDVDPIKFGLMFERFMNPVRAEFDPPDCDLDFQASRRDEVKRYLQSRYKAVIPIGTYGRMWDSSVVKDIGRVMEIPFDRLNRLTKGRDLATMREAGEDFPQELFEVAEVLKGRARHCSIHPSGVVIADEELLGVLPLQTVKGEVVTQWTDKMVGARGYLKLDILGLQTLDVLKGTLDRLGWNNEDLLKIPLDDLATIGTFHNGDLAGVFQFETAHMRELSVRMGVKSFADLVALNALGRPACVLSGTTDTYIKRRKGEQPVEYVHPALAGILGETYGVPIYQELIMKTLHVVGGLSLTDTEIVRDAIKHFKHEVMSSYEKQFLEGAIKKGATPEQAKSVWEMCKTASGYTFNKAHATSYALLAYWCAYLKIHHPKEFFWSLLVNESNEVRVVQYVEECQRRGIRVLPPSVWLSDMSWTWDHRAEGLRAGLVQVKGVGAKAAQEILRCRGEKDKEQLLQCIDRKKCNKRVVEALEQARAFEKDDDWDSRKGIVGVPKVRQRDYSELLYCNSCSLRSRCRTVVLGRGNMDSPLYFVGEAPGQDEDKRGIPFCGRAGAVLDAILEELGVNREQVWIDNVVHCHPHSNGRNRTPTPEEVEVCYPWIASLLAERKPSLVVSLGRTPLYALSGGKYKSVSSMEGETYEIFVGGERLEGYCLRHPASLLYHEPDDRFCQALGSLRELIRKRFVFSS